jgi:RimJ/RimL family protein N-acetyltransferase
MSGPVTSLFEGCALSYAQSGDGPPVVFIQGVGVHGSGWAPQVASLRTDYTCLTFDNRGIGNSQPLGASLSVTQMARDAVHLMDQVGWSSAHIVGHSMGGPIAMQMALDNRDRVRSLSLLCTVGRGRDATRLTGRMLVLGALSRIGSRRSRLTLRGWQFVRRPSWAIVLGGEVVGGISLRLDFPNRLGELGYSMARRACNKRYVTEAARAVIDPAFSAHEDLNRIRAFADVGNLASQRVMEKVGMTKEGVLRQNRVKRGAPLDEAWFGILRREWSLGTSRWCVVIGRRAGSSARWSSLP